ncbi:hypothetical protein RhiirA4_480324 [Rhizophagus irregularis]|uniref:Uncharacterized protein n=1 Tax=Rhizophagus irregularis TaxID=588596 RepID=A0A2I1HHW6_9GLOM|nr:hypothetical protein RhiirA4_480324 [Rhizophagus irregularis]
MTEIFMKACNAEKQKIKANQDEILCWYHYIIEFDNQVKSVMKTNQIGEKKVKEQIYDFIIAQLRIDKIKYITTYSVNSILELSDSQIQTIIDYCAKNLNTELPDGVPLGSDQNGSFIDSKDNILNDQDNILEEQAKQDPGHLL